MCQDACQLTPDLIGTPENPGALLDLYGTVDYCLKPHITAPGEAFDTTSMLMIREVCARAHDALRASKSSQPVSAE